MWKKRWSSLVLAILVCCVSLTACSDTETSEGLDNAMKAGYDPNDTWAIYWYLCGSDLESQNGAATADLMEMMEVTLPENVQVIIETGGASAWQNEVVQAEKIQRFLYAGSEMKLIEEQPNANMGESQTFGDFLSFCKKNYPADHTMVLFWNHGGGSVSGAAFDENFQNDSLTLDEMYAAFDSVYELAEEEPPFELVGFDTCLMATIDTACTYSEIARYLVASEELEPGNGWNYTGWLGALAENPGMNGAQLGQVICDAYVEGCEASGTADEITLSVVDLQKVAPLSTAYNNIGKEALAAACVDPIFFTEFGRSARAAENYGGNTPNEGYTNMVDLGDLVRKSENILTENAELLLGALEDCVVYKVNGPYRTQASGLSCYYPYSVTDEEFGGFTQNGVSEPFKYLYGYGLSGDLSEEGKQYVAEMGYDEMPDIPKLDATELSGQELSVDNNGNAVLTLDSKVADLLSGVYFQLAYVDPQEDIILLLGRDNDIDANWESGVFKDNFRGVWGALDGHLCYMELSTEGENYNVYAVPILLNGEEYNLHVAYSFEQETYKILGARAGLDEQTGMADKNLRQLKDGDKITTLHYAMTISGDDTEYQQVEMDTFAVTENTSFQEQDLGDGSFVMLFEMVDAQNQSIYSNSVTFTVEEGTITTEIEE